MILQNQANLFDFLTYYDRIPYVHAQFIDIKAYAMGEPREYVTALLDYGLGLKEAIEFTAKKYTSINDNIKVLEIKY